MNRRWRRVQGASGLFVACFLVVHLANTMAAASSGAAYDGFQLAARRLYQAPVVEVLLLAAIAVHVVAGLRSALLRPRAKARLPWRTRLHRWSAWYLFAVITGHVLATRGLAVFRGVEPRFAGLTFSFAWLPWLFGPYYTLLALAGLYHGAHGAFLAAGMLGRVVPERWRSGPRFWVPVGLAAGGLLLGLAGIAGLLYPLHDPFDNRYARLYQAMFGGLVPGGRPHRVPSTR